MRERRMVVVVVCLVGGSGISKEYGVWVRLKRGIKEGLVEFYPPRGEVYNFFEKGQVVIGVREAKKG